MSHVTRLTGMLSPVQMCVYMCSNAISFYTHERKSIERNFNSSVMLWSKSLPNNFGSAHSLHCHSSHIHFKCMASTTKPDIESHEFDNDVQEQSFAESNLSIVNCMQTYGCDHVTRSDCYGNCNPNDTNPPRNNFLEMGPSFSVTGRPKMSTFDATLSPFIRPNKKTLKLIPCLCMFKAEMIPHLHINI